MTLSPSDILERMDKLKRWQEEQERLMLQHHKRLNENNFLGDDFIQTTFCESRPIIQSHGSTAPDFDNTTPKPKQAFLRRGSGLSRFKMVPGEQFKTLTKSKGTIQNSSPKTMEVKTILNTPEQRSNSKGTWTNGVGGLQDKNSSLLMFEALEKKLLENSVYGADSPSISENNRAGSPIKNQAFERSDNLKAHWHIVQSPTPECLFVEQKKESYKANELYEDVERNKKLIQGHNKQMEEFDQFEKHLHEELLASLEQAIKFEHFLKQDKAVGSSSQISTMSNDTNENPSEEPVKDFDDLEKWDSNLSLDESTSSTISSSQIMDKNVVQYSVGTMTDPVPVQDHTMDEIEKLQNHLKQELKATQEQKKEASKLKKQLEHQSRDLDKQKKTLLKQIEEEKESFHSSNALLEEEKKKLHKEKMVFEKYVKDLQNKPNRKEREEISILKEELATLKETYKLKEVRTSTVQARLRNQIKHLEKENTELKLEIEKLNKENGKLIAMQRLSKKPSDTKLLHEINKNITKLAKEQSAKITENHLDVKLITTREKENDKNASNSSDSEKHQGGQCHKSLSPEKDCNNDQFRQDISSNPKCTTHTLKNIDGTKISTASNRIEEITSDGTRIVTYTNGNVKTVSSDGNTVEFKYKNGDIKTTKLLEGAVCYYYHQSRIQHTSKADGTEILQYPDGQIETRFTNGSSEVKHPNGNIVIVNEEGKTLILANGQKEIHTKEHKRREYPDGTVKILYADGRQETRYSNGRVRIKDNHGALLFDSMG